MTDFTNIREALSNLLTAVEDTAVQLTNEANAQRRELIALYARMHETSKDLCEFGAMIGETGAALLDIEDLCEDVAVKATTAIEGGADCTPSCDYEEFIDFCDECGREIVEGDEYDTEAGGFVICPECLAKAKAEQLTFEDLAETVAHPTEETSAE